MSYSSLVNYRNMTSHRDKGRGGYETKKVAICIHHMAGKLSVQQCGTVFKNYEVSAHYGIQDKNIGVYVDESDTAWAVGNAKWNRMTINIELSNDSGSPSWHVSEETIQTCIKLVADIAYRLDWTYISYTGDLNGDIIAHRWIASTACPGPYLMTKLAYIAQEADKLLKAKRKSVATAPINVAKTATGTAYPKYLPSKTIRRGDKGIDVSAWQAFINWYFGKQKPLACDGIFGPATEKWTKEFQRNYKHLEVDGIVGPQTIKTAKDARK